jgi:hypothetical protein
VARRNGKPTFGIKRQSDSTLKGHGPFFCVDDSENLRIGMGEKPSVSHFSPLFSTLENKNNQVKAFFHIFLNDNKGLPHFFQKILAQKLYTNQWVKIGT